jgi:hypothetical protein
MSFTVVTLIATMDIKRKESANPALMQATIISAVGTVITLGVLVLSLVLTLGMLA